ncbi:hypothetical protein ACS0TY_020038 [Phlomoides rotata]
MSSKILSTSLHLCSNSNISSKKSDIFSVSFNSQVTKSRISIRNQSGPLRAAATVRMKAFNDPTESRETLYELLGITETGSSYSDIKKAYKEMARKYHPDVSPPDQVDEYTRRFVMVHEAYETLSDPQTRASYDRSLEGGFSSTKSQQYYQFQKEEKAEWKKQWLSQLDELKQRGSRGRMSWGARMRNEI